MLRFWQRRKDDERPQAPTTSSSEPSRKSQEVDKGAFQPGMQIAGKFTLQRLIASGSMGSVFEAWDMFIERRVAIKLMQPSFAHDPSMIARFRREAQTSAAIQHPNVVTIHEVGQRSDGTFYMVQELLIGETLRDYHAARGRLTEHEAMTIMVPIMGALCAAHKRGIVHRDIKPENIILTTSPNGEIVPKLVDFGLARVHQPLESGGRKLTLSGVVMGTPEYMAPEQAQGHPGVDARADVWSVGAVLFELLSGKRPFDGPTHQAVLIKLVTEQPPMLAALVDDIPAAFLAVVQGALVPEREKRMPTMQAFRDRLLWAYEHISHRQVLAPAGETALVDEPGPESEGADEKTQLRPQEISLADVDELDPADLILDEESHDEADETRTSKPEVPLSSLPRSDFEWRDAANAWTQSPPTKEETIAYDALGSNALRDAIGLAEKAVVASPNNPEVRGRMRLVQAIAQRWLGNVAEVQRAAEEALTLLPRGSTAFHAALGHVVMVCGSLGQEDRIRQIADDLDLLEREGITSEAHVVTACRTVVALIRAGLPERAHEVLASAQKLVHRHGVVSSFVVAWLDVARAEAAVHAGDLTTYVRRVESAVENFTSAGDLRNACLQRCNIGNAYLQLGAYGLAVTQFREAHAIAEPMKLDIIASILANMGYALARMDDVVEAREVETAALEKVVALGNRRGEGFVRVYLSTILRLAGEMDASLEMARSAVAISDGLPAVRGYALALIAGVLIAKGADEEAYRHAHEAMEIVKRLGGIEEGESLIRWTYALALRAVGNEDEALVEIKEARRRLLVRADRISDPRWRQSFLEQVPDNARVMEFAAIWLGEK